MTQLKLVTALCLAFGIMSVAVARDYYVWVDEDGVTNFSERSPRGRNARHVTDSTPFGEPADSTDARRPGRQRPDATAEESGADRNTPTNADSQPGGQQQIDPDELASEQREELEQQIAETRRKNCDLGKRNLARLQAYARIRVEGEDGEERLLTEEEKQARIDEAREIILDNCTG